VYDYETNEVAMSFKNMFRPNYDLHPHIHARRATDIYTDIPRNKFVDNLPNFINPKLWNKWTEIVDVHKSKYSIRGQMKNLLLNKQRHKQIL